MALSVPDAIRRDPGSKRTDSSAAFAWSPEARYLAGAWSGWPAGLHLFDLHGKLYLGKFGSENAAGPRTSANLAWSDSGDFFVATSRGKNASLRVWEPKGGPLAGDAAREILEADWIEPQQAGEEFAEEGAFGGYGRAAFSPNEEALASVIEFRGEWADDSIVVRMSRRFRGEKCSPRRAT